MMVMCVQGVVQPLLCDSVGASPSGVEAGSAHDICVTSAMPDTLFDMQCAAGKYWNEVSHQCADVRIRFSAFVQ